MADSRFCLCQDLIIPHAAIISSLACRSLNNMSENTFFFFSFPWVLYLDNTSLQSTQSSWWDILQALCGILFSRILLSSGETTYFSLLELLPGHATPGKFKYESKLKKANWLYSNKELSSWLQAWKQLHMQKRKQAQRFKKPTVTLTTTSCLSCHLCFFSSAIKVKGPIQQNSPSIGWAFWVDYRPGVSINLHTQGVPWFYWMQTKLQSPLSSTPLFLYLFRVSFPPAVLA